MTSSKRRVWTDYELEILKKYYPIGGWQLCQEKGIKRDGKSIVNKANRLEKAINPIMMDEGAKRLIYQLYVVESRSVKYIQDYLNKKGYDISHYYINKYIKENNLVKTKNWSDREIAILEKYYPIGGSRLCIEKGVKRGVHDIGVKAQSIGVKQGKDYKGWEQWEKDYILNNYKNSSVEEIAKHLCRSEMSIRNYGNKKLKIKFNNYTEWTDKEIELIKEYYPKGGANLCIEKGITKDRGKISYKAGVLNLKAPECWTDNDIAILKEYYPKGGANLCIEKGINKKPSAIVSYANRVGLSTGKFDDRSYWGKGDLEILKKYYPLGGADLCIEKGLNRKRNPIKSKANSLNLKVPLAWTDKDKAILREYYPKGGYRLCQEKGLDKEKTKIINYANNLGLSTGKCDNRTNWEDWEIELVRKYYPQGGYDLCKEKGLKRSSIALREKLKRIDGIKVQDN